MIYLSVILLYLLILIGIGIVKSRKINTQSDFALAGRSLTPWILVGTMLATWIGTGSILGNAGKTYEIGMAALLLPIGSIMGIILLTKIAGKVRNVKKFTVPEIIGDRYGSFARNLCVFALVSAYMVIVSYQYNAGGAVIYTVFSNQIQSLLNKKSKSFPGCPLLLLPESRVPKSGDTQCLPETLRGGVR